MGAIVKCSVCEHQTRYDSSEIVERGGQWVVKCLGCGDDVLVGKVISLEEQIREAQQQHIAE